MLQIPRFSLGADPELFFKKGGEIVGAERVIPEEGVYYNRIVLDGVQAELHPPASYSVAGIGTDLATTFSRLKTHLTSTPEISACFTAVVDVSRKELNALSNAARVLGCAPSRNFYGIKKLDVDATRYRKRSAGGHIHIGLDRDLFEARQRLVPIMDVIVGNTCVMIDRDPLQRERRKLYGRAGEYRLPSHGVEYRTLSNFWLQSIPLTCLVMGLTQIAVGILNTTLLHPKADIEQELFDTINLRNVVRAIQRNDLALAKENWQVVKAYCEKHVQTEGPIPVATLGKFEKFLAVIEQKGLQEWFPDNPIDHWTKVKNVTGSEWGTFLSSIEE